MARTRIDDELGSAAVATVQAIAAGLDATDGRTLAGSVDRTTLALAVRYTLQLLSEQAPGGTVVGDDSSHLECSSADVVVDPRACHGSIIPDSERR